MTALYLYICVPVFCCFVFALSCLLTRHGRRKEAVCWFCHCKQTGNYQDNGWTCRHCEQYNGFTEVCAYFGHNSNHRVAQTCRYLNGFIAILIKQDGGYDREMTEQYADGSATPVRYCSRGRQACRVRSGVRIGRLSGANLSKVAEAQLCKEVCGTSGQLTCPDTPLASMRVAKLTW